MLLEGFNKGKIGSFKIGNSVYDVLDTADLKRDGVGCSGICDYGSKEIHINTDPKEDLSLTLTHEIIHAIINEIYLKSKNNKKFYKRLRSDEFFVESFAREINKNFKLKLKW